MNKKGIWAISIVVLMLLVIIGGVLIYSAKSEEPSMIDIEEVVFIEYSDMVFEYYEIAKYDDNIFGEGMEIEEGYIDTTELGEFSQRVKCNVDGGYGYIDVEYKVVDTTSPIIMGGTYFTIYVGEEFDHESKFLIADNYDKKAKFHILGEYDLNVVGKYEVEAKVIDSSENSVSQSMTLNVIEKPESTSGGNDATYTYTPTKIYFDDIVEKHKTEQTMIGIDVSKWQGEINWDKVKESGVEFAMIRIGYEGSSTGEFAIDETFEYNLENAQRVGIDVGIYFYSLSNTVEKAQAQATQILEILDGRTLELPIVFDWEIWDKFNSWNISLQDLNNMANIFIETVEDAGYTGMNYGSATYLRTFFYKDKLTWLAHYTDETNYEYDYGMWQLTDSGQVEGIYGNVDLNVLYKQNM